MKVLVTGATGFIGGRVAHALVGHGYEVRAMVRDGSSRLALDGTGAQTVLGDVRDRESVTAALNECQGLVHCAARYSFWNPRPDTTYDVNVNGTRIILEEALRAGLTSWRIHQYRIYGGTGQRASYRGSGPHGINTWWDITRGPSSSPRGRLWGWPQKVCPWWW